MTTIEPLYVADTNALLWYFAGNKKLSRTAAAIFNAAGNHECLIYISAISIAELYYADQKWLIFTHLRTLYERIVGSEHFSIVPFDSDHVLDFDRDAHIPEMHDRIIVGLARRLDAPVITSDSIVIASGLARIAW
jgi:PIN domain nuclease of toxin-antitoxin system